MTSGARNAYTARPPSGSHYPRSAAGNLICVSAPSARPGEIDLGSLESPTAGCEVRHICAHVAPGPGWAATSQGQHGVLRARMHVGAYGCWPLILPPQRPVRHNPKISRASGANSETDVQLFLGEAAVFSDHAQWEQHCPPPLMCTTERGP